MFSVNTSCNVEYKDMQQYCTVVFALVYLIKLPHCVCEFKLITLVAEMAVTTASAISIPKPFTEGNPVKWFQRYDICCTANVWEDKAKLKD